MKFVNRLQTTFEEYFKTFSSVLFLTMGCNLYGQSIVLDYGMQPVWTEK